MKSEWCCGRKMSDLFVINMFGFIIKINKDDEMVRFYLIFIVLGVLLFYGVFVFWLVINGLEIGFLFSEVVVNLISIFVWFDVLVMVIVLLVFVIVDG